MGEDLAHCQYEFMHGCGGALFCLQYQSPAVTGWTHWTGPRWICAGALSDLRGRGMAVVQAPPPRQATPIYSSYATTSMNIDLTQQHVYNAFLSGGYDRPIVYGEQVAAMAKAMPPSLEKAPEKKESPKEIFFCINAMPPHLLATLRVPVMMPMEGVKDVPYVVTSAERRNYERHEKYFAEHASAAGTTMSGIARVWPMRENVKVPEELRERAQRLGRPVGLQCRLCGGGLYKREG